MTALRLPWRQPCNELAQRVHIVSARALPFTLLGEFVLLMRPPVWSSTLVQVMVAMGSGRFDRSQVTESRVCQLHGQSIARLRTKLRDG